MSNMYKFTFDVALKNVNGYYSQPIRSEEIANEVAKWYHSLIIDFDDYSNLSFVPKKNGEIYHMNCILKFVNCEDETNALFHEELIRDPDEDGNYPIKIDNEEYLVIGSEINN